MPEHHTVLGGKVHLYKRDDDSRYWQCASYLAGKNRRESTKEESLAKAKDFAEDWYLGLRGKLRDGVLITEKTFRDAAAQFEREYEIITEGQRNRVYVNDNKRRLRIHLVPFFGNMGLSKINQTTAAHAFGPLFRQHGAFKNKPNDGCASIWSPFSATWGFQK